MTSFGVPRIKKKLVVSGLASGWDAAGVGEGRAHVEALRKEKEIKRRCESVVRWCESFGAVRRVERKPDGSLHVYWRDWETADMVSASAAFLGIYLMVSADGDFWVLCRFAVLVGRCTSEALGG